MINTNSNRLQANKGGSNKPLCFSKTFSSWPPKQDAEEDDPLVGWVEVAGPRMHSENFRGEQNVLQLWHGKDEKTFRGGVCHTGNENRSL